MIDDPAAQQRADRGRNCGKPGPGTDRPAPFGLRERGADDRERTRDQECCADPLNAASSYQQAHVRSERAAKGGDGEDYNSNDEDTAAAELIAGSATDQEECRKTERIGIDDPLYCYNRDRQVLGDGGQRDVDDRLVDIGDDRCENGRNQYPSPGVRGAIGGAASRPDRLLVARPCYEIDQTGCPPRFKFTPRRHRPRRH